MKSTAPPPHNSPHPLLFDTLKAVDGGGCHLSPCYILFFLPMPGLFNSLDFISFLVISIFTCLHLVFMVYAVIFLINLLAFILIKHS